MKLDISRIASIIVATVACGALLSYGITEEIPMGNIEGSVIMKETGKPLVNALIEFEPGMTLRNDEIELRTRFARSDKDGKFKMPYAIAGYYKISVSTAAHRVDGEFRYVEDGATEAINLAAEPVDPYLDITTSQHVFSPDEKVEFELRGFQHHQPKEFFVKAYKLDFEKAVAAGSMYEAFSPFTRSDAKFDPATKGKLVKEWSQPITNRDAEGIFMHRVKPEDLAEGLYWIGVSTGPKMVARGTWLNITKLSMVGKRAKGQALAFVSDIKTGDPIANAPVGFSTKSGIKIAAQTDGSGIAKIAWPAEAGQVLIAQSGESRALVDFYRENENPDSTQIVMYGDRTVYKAGDTACFKGIVRKLADKDLVIPAPQPITLQLLDESENVIGSSRADMSDMGTFSGKFELSKEAEPGYYQVRAKIGEASHSLGVSVSAYRKPTYTITVTPEKPNYVRGERGRFKVHAEYYYGGPVPGAKVDAHIYSEIDWYDPEMQEYFEGSEGRGVSGSFSESSETKTDANGDAFIEFNTLGGDSPISNEYDQRFSASVSVADEGGKYFDGSGSVLVTRGDFRLTTESNVYVAAPNTPVTYKFKAEAFGDTPVANRTVDVASGEEHWDGKGYTVLDTQRQTITLDANGEGTVTITPKHGGSLSIVGTMKDERGNLISATTYLWVSGTWDGDMGPVPSLSLKLDKSNYKQGESALVLIQTDKPGGTALVTIESDKVLLSQTVKLTDEMTSLNLAVLDEYTPQVTVSVCYVKEKSFASAARRMQIDLGRRKLDVEVTPEKPKYQPGEMASFSVKTSVAGAPVPAEISLGLVDESIYAIAADDFSIADELYPKASNLVETQYSFPQLYLDGGDKAPTSIQVRRIFKDTAFWAPSVYTDGTGQTTVTMKLPDNLTTWRATVRGITNRSEAGQATAKIMAAKDLMVRVEGPSFFVAGDRQTINAVVTNSTDKDATVKLQFEPKNITLGGDSQRSVEVKAGGTGSVQVELTAVQTGDANLVAKAWIDGGATDGVEQHFEIRPAGVLIQQAVSGNSLDQPSFQIDLDSLADKNHGRLKITLSPTIGGSVLQSLDELIDFPYGCVEQTMSRFLPAIVAVQASKELGLPPLERAPELPAIVSDSLVRLGNMQHSDGGWGWWEEDNTDAHMTAYVLEGLLRAKAYGYRVPEQMLTRGIEAATKLLEAKVSPDAWVNTPEELSHFWIEETNKRMYLATVLMQTSGRNASAKFVATVSLEKATALTAAYLAYFQKLSGTDPSTAIKKLESFARISGPIAKWDESYWGVETTARCVQLLAKVQPTHPLIPKAIQYLISEKRSNYWRSTRDTAYAVLALTEYFKSTKETVNLKGEAVVQLNNQEVGRVVFTGDHSSSPSHVLTIPVNQLQVGSNAITVRRVDGGRAYYSAELRAYSPTLPTSPLGLKVTRTYHRMETRRLQDGTTKFVASETPSTSFEKGDLVQVRLVLASSSEREFMLIEDPIPASFRITDRDTLPDYESWNWWWSNWHFYDDRAAVFAQRLPLGESVITYVMRAEMVGKAQANPTSAYNMYDPQNRSFSNSISVEVR